MSPSGFCQEFLMHANTYIQMYTCTQLQKHACKYMHVKHICLSVKTFRAHSYFVPFCSVSVRKNEAEGKITNFHYFRVFCSFLKTCVKECKTALKFVSPLSPKSLKVFILYPEFFRRNFCGYKKYVGSLIVP